MREIKFRDYNPETKEMRHFDLDEYDREEHNCYGNIMQYTGLKDKNGKEIYEGDIVKIVEDKNIKVANQPHQFMFGDIAKVEWSNVNLAYYLVNENHEEIECQMDYYGAWSGWNWLEVIGNIYENMELLR